MSEATRRSYDAVAARYAQEVGGELAGKPADRALLVGCGPGHVAEYLNGRGARVTAVDLSPSMCAIARTAHVTGQGQTPAVAGDMTALPIRSGALSGLVCLYAVIHLDRDERGAAYAEFARALAPGAQALIAFHTHAAGVVPGTAVDLTEWWDEAVELTFRYLDPEGEVTLLTGADLRPVDRLDRNFYPGVEHASRRCYLTVERPHRGARIY